MRILLIEDSKEDRELFKKYAQKSNKMELIVDECENLNKGLKKIYSSDYDVIILDLSLPETDGIDTILSLMEYMKKANKNVPIIVITGTDDLSIGQSAFDLGIKDFLSKEEINTKEIIRSINFATYSANNKVYAKKQKAG